MTSRKMKFYQTLALGIFLLVQYIGAQQVTAQSSSGQWYVQNDGGTTPEKRHESCFVEVGGKFYLIGGRGTKKIQIYNPETKQWSNTKTSTNDIHHFQAVAYKSKIYIIGAFKGPFPSEDPVKNVLIYDTNQDKLITGPTIPPGRLRGSSGVVLYDCKFYIVSGNRKGHKAFTSSGEPSHVKWFDCFDPETNSWTVLPNAPNARDHFHAAVIGTRLYVAGGRRSSQGTTAGTFSDTEEDVDVFDFVQKKWLSGSALPDDIPTERAGASVTAFGMELIVIGGETESNNSVSLPKTEILDTYSGKWRTLSKMKTGRHATQAILYKGDVYLAAGSKTKGGTEITSSENFIEAFSFDGSPGASPFSNWTNVSNLDEARSESQCIVYQDEVYFINGFAPNIKIENSCEKYNPYTNRWTTLTSLTDQGLSQGITHNGIALVGDTIWCVGGRVGTAGTVTNDVWWYVIHQDKWYAGPDLPAPAGGGGLARLGRKLHLVGGFDSKAQCDVNTHLVYDLDEPGKGWQNITASAGMPDARNHFGTAVVNGKMYVIGGQHGHDAGCSFISNPAANVNDVHVYDPVTNDWDKLANFPHNESHIEPSTFALDGDIIVVGGQSGNGDEVNKYDVSSNTWKELGQYNLPLRLLAPGARVFDETLVVMAGGAPNTTNPTSVTRKKHFSRNPLKQLSFNPKTLNVSLSDSQKKSVEVILSSMDGSAEYYLNNLPSWLSVNKEKGTAYLSFEEIELTFDASKVGSGTYSFQLKANSKGYTDGVINITFVKNGGGGNTPDPELKELALINTNTNTKIRALNAGNDKIVLDNLPSGISIEAVAESNVGSVAFVVNGQEVKVESVAPYALGGDSGGNFDPYPFTPGTYSIVVTPYSGSGKSGKAGDPISLTLVVEQSGTVDPPAAEITDLVLVNASNGQAIRSLNTNTGSDVIVLDKLPSGLSIEALANNETESVSFSVNGVSRTENVAPYSLAGDQTTSFTPYPFTPGTYTITVQPFTGNSKSGEAGDAVTVVLTVQQSDTPPVGDDLAVTDLVLISASNAQAIRTLQKGSDVLVLDQLPSTLSIQALVGDDVKSVSFNVNSDPARTESFAPFSLAGDQPGSYTPYPFEEGVYTIQVTPFSEKSKGGEQGETFVLTLTVTDGGIDPTAMKFSLINATSNQVVLSPITAGSQINVNTLSSFNVSVENTPSGTQSVVFQVVNAPGGIVGRTESVAPYAFFGDNSGDFFGKPATAGDAYSLIAKAHSGTKGSGNVLEQISVDFSFVAGAQKPAEPTATTLPQHGDLKVLRVYPNTIQDSQTLRIKLTGQGAETLKYTLHDQYGKEIFTQDVQLDGADDVSLGLNINTLLPGLYFLSIEGEEIESKVIRLLKN